MGRTKPASCHVSHAHCRPRSGRELIDEQQLFCRQCDHAESGRVPTSLLSVSQRTADLWSSWHIAAADPS